MADKKISDLGANSSLSGSEYVELVQSGANVKALLSALKTFITSGFLTSSTAASTYLTIANSRFILETITGTTYTLAANKVTSNGRYVLEFSDNAFTSLTLDTPTSLGVATGDSVQVRITGTYAAQTLVAGSGATIEGSAAFNAQWHTKTLIAKSSTAWAVVG
jgi:hypothetical protein